MKLTVNSPAGATDRMLLKAAGLSPDTHSIERVLAMRERAEDFAYTLQVVKRRTDLPSLTQAVSRARKLRPLKARTGGAGRARVYLFTDPQIGKVDSRFGEVGGTPEFVARMARIRAEISADLRTRPVEAALIADGGDGIESVQNTSTQLFTNDLSEPQQVDLYATTLHERITDIQRHVPHLDVAVCPSNHARWRRGKEQLGRVGDDWGLTVHHMVQRMTDPAIRFHEPASLWEDITYVNVLGHRVALHHGDQARSGSTGMATWYAKKSSSGDFRDVELLLTGHYHHLLFTPMGRGWWLQGPALDAGSSWFAHSGGAESQPGLVAIDITCDGGVDVSSLHLFDGSTVELDIAA